MDYVLISLSYDFGQKRASASIQCLNDANNPVAFINVNVAVVPPSDISAADLNDYIVTEVRKTLKESIKFTEPQR